MQKPFTAAAIPLTGPFDNRTLPHGLYIAESASPAYPLLKAMTIAKQASVVGETNIARVSLAMPGQEHGVVHASRLLMAKTAEDIPAKIKDRAPLLDGNPGFLALLVVPGWINGDPPIVQDDGQDREVLWME
jgi:hypothetical protein